MSGRCRFSSLSEVHRNVTSTDNLLRWRASTFEVLFPVREVFTVLWFFFYYESFFPVFFSSQKIATSSWVQVLQNTRFLYMCKSKRIYLSIWMLTCREKNNANLSLIVHEKNMIMNLFYNKYFIQYDARTNARTRARDTHTHTHICTKSLFWKCRMFLSIIMKISKVFSWKQSFPYEEAKNVCYYAWWGYLFIHIFVY